MPIDPFERKPANQLAVQAGYCAPYLHILYDDAPEPDRRKPTAYTKRKLRSVIRAIKAGFGQGRGDAYSPWIRIRRNFSSPVSHQVFDSVGVKAGNEPRKPTLSPS